MCLCWLTYTNIHFWNCHFCHSGIRWIASCTLGKHSTMSSVILLPVPVFLELTHTMCKLQLQGDQTPLWHLHVCLCICTHEHTRVHAQFFLFVFGGSLLLLVFFLLWGSRQSFFCVALAVLNSLCRPGCTWTHRDPLASPSLSYWDYRYVPLRPAHTHRI